MSRTVALQSFVPSNGRVCQDVYLVRLEVRSAQLNSTYADKIVRLILRLGLTVNMPNLLLQIRRLPQLRLLRTSTWIPSLRRIQPGSLPPLLFLVLLCQNSRRSIRDRIALLPIPSRLNRLQVRSYVGATEVGGSGATRELRLLLFPARIEEFDFQVGVEAVDGDLLAAVGTEGCGGAGRRGLERAGCSLI